MLTSEIQQRLKGLGYYSGDIDNRRGLKTVAAIKAFQIAHGLAADGRVGPITAAALFPGDVPETHDAVEAPQKPSADAASWPLQSGCMSYYGGVGLFQKTLDLPFPMRLSWDLKTVIRRFCVHEKVHASASRVFARIAQTFDEGQRRALGIDIFGGCLNVRKMRGGDSYSMHSWGIAIDFDPDRNMLDWGRDKARLAQPDAEPFWRCWEEEGWLSLGRARNFDWMHVQAARLP